MFNLIRNNISKMFAWWILLMQRHAIAVIIIAIISTCGVLIYAVRNFDIDTDMSGMISGDLPFRKDEKDFQRAFPRNSDSIVVVIDADTAEDAVIARDRLAERLGKETNLFKSIYVPGGGSFFEENGLLYLDLDQLQDLSDNLAAVQPLLALFTKELSLHNLFSILDMVIKKKNEVDIPSNRMDSLYDGMSASLDGVLQGKPHRLSWQHLMAGDSGRLDQRRQFIILRPNIDQNILSGAKVPLEYTGRIARELGLDESHGIRVRLTGDVALANENLETIQGHIIIAVLVSIILVTVILWLGMGGSLFLTAANMFTLVIGLVWTSGFALAAIGKFNLISITFTVIYIGVGIDFSLLFCLIYRDYLGLGKDNPDAIAAASANVGKGLFLCMAAVSIGFFSFVPTAYAGASDLGIIAGTGIIINLIVNFSLLPALLTTFPLDKNKVRPSRITSSAVARKITEFPFAHSRGILACAALIGLGAAAISSRFSFDYNPLNLYNPASDAVSTIKDLFKDPDSTPWTISVLVKGAEQTRETTDRLSKLKEVKMAVSLLDFVPEQQMEKFAVISDMALFMPPVPAEMNLKHANAGETIKALSRLADELKRSYLSGIEPPNPHAARLHDSIRRFIKYASDRDKEEMAFSSLENALLSNLPVLLRRLELSLHPTGISRDGLPHDLVEQYLAIDGRYRIQVFPRENVTNVDALKRFVSAVRTIAPHATDSAVSVLESGNAVVSSFRNAMIIALIAITIFLMIELRSILATLLALVPFILAALLTAASSTFLNVPLNFANVIVLPLLLGLGVDNGIHFIFRNNRDPAGNPNVLQTSTTRAVFYNTAAGVGGFSSLIWMPHKGLASMGIILTLCMSYVIICTVTVMPALMNLFKDRLESVD